MKAAVQSAASAIKSAAQPEERFFNKKDVLLAGLVFFISYAFYLFSLYPTVATEDAGEFTAAAYGLGVAHPPGYPLFVILAKIFTVLIPFGNIAWRVNLFSAFFAAATVAAIYFLTRLLAKDPAIGVITALFFASGEIFWSQAVRAEVYSLNTFLMVLTVFLALLWFFQLSLDHALKARKTLSWLAFIYGLSLTNHQLMFLLGPPLAIFVLITKSKILLDYRFILKLLGFFLLGLSLYLFLPLSASYKPDVNWGNPVTWNGFWQHVTRAVYGMENISPIKESAAITTPAANHFADFFRFHVYEFGRRFLLVLDANYTWVAGLLGIFGFVFLWIRSRKIFWFFVALVIFNSFILSALVGVGNINKLPMRFFTDRPFFIPLLLTTVVLAGCGIRYLVSLAYERGKRTAPAAQRQTGIYLLAGIMTILLVYRFPSQNQSGNYIAYDLAKAALSILPENAVLHSENGDNTVLPMLYLQKVEKVRPDIKIYINMPFSIYNYFESLAKMESENPGKRLFTDFPFVYYPGLKYRFMGPVSELILDEEDDNNTDALKQFEAAKIRGIGASSLDHFNMYLKVRYLLDLGIAYSKNPDEQKKYFEESFAAAPESQNIIGQLIGNIYLRQDKFSEAIPYLEAARRMMPDEYPIGFQLTLSYIMSGSSDKAEQLIQGLKQGNRDMLIKELNILATKMPDRYPALFEFTQKAIK